MIINIKDEEKELEKGYPNKMDKHKRTSSRSVTNEKNRLFVNPFKKLKTSSQISNEESITTYVRALTKSVRSRDRKSTGG